MLDDVKHRTAEIGYWISESLWGKGIMTEAIGSLVPEAFRQYAIVRLQAGIFSKQPRFDASLGEVWFFP
jgi:RimJ/RimL family protein N-acetyltransferase